MNKKEIVYVVKYSLMKIDIVKIGRTSNLENRLKQIKGSLPGSIELIKSFEVNNSYRLEKYFHYKFAEYLYELEWFDSIVVDMVDQMYDDYDDNDEYINYNHPTSVFLHHQENGKIYIDNKTEECCKNLIYNYKSKLFRFYKDKCFNKFICLMDRELPEIPKGFYEVDYNGFRSISLRDTGNVIGNMLSEEINSKTFIRWSPKLIENTTGISVRSLKNTNKTKWFYDSFIKIKIKTTDSLYSSLTIVGYKEDYSDELLNEWFLNRFPNHKILDIKMMNSKRKKR